MPQDPSLPPREDVAAEINLRCPDKQLPCAVAFDMAVKFAVTPLAVGHTADALGVRLIKCQLGLFGYAPKKKIVTPAKTDRPDIVAAIREALIDDRLPCEAAWRIARRFSVSKMTVSSICEAAQIKIKPCQLGAF